MKIEKTTLILIVITTFFVYGTIIGICKNWNKSEANTIIKKSEDVIR